MSRKLLRKVFMYSGSAPLVALVVAGVLQVTAPEAKAIAARRPVDLVICLDTSGSMTELIDSARAKLWDVVNQLAAAEPTPQLRVGLLTYGTPGNSSAAQGWVLRHTDLTDDLDTVYAKMMAMRTSGGDEYVGWVLSEAVSAMNWSRDPDALRIIFVAGNESADQARDRYDFRHVGETARSRGIFINAIYAGGSDQGMTEHWHEVALHGGGNYSAIDTKCGTIQISTPQDKLLLELNMKLNATYVPYGSYGAAGAMNQREQDANAASLGPQSCASRASAKGTALYSNGGWDLVDALRDGKIKVEELPASELPENMQPMTADERSAYVEGMQRARSAVQQEIKEATAAREKFLAAERQKQTGKTSLDDAIIEALRKQAESKGFRFGPADGC